MLKFREIDYNKDIPAVVLLIKDGLDDNYTETFFEWKHVSNPFGKSFGLLVEDEGRIIGLRMFMFWQFISSKGQPLITAIRPVDTVVDKKYRSQGLFKKLTLDGIEMCQGKFDLIFNTPNENSLPGYLKMGWNLMENSPNIKMGLLNPLSKGVAIREININSLELDKDDRSSTLMWQTNKTCDFLKWRYPDTQYKLVQFQDCVLIYSTTNIKNFKTIIIFELLGNPKKFQGLINGLAKKIKSYLVYFADTQEFNAVQFMGSLTRKNSNIVFKNDKYGINGNINFSLGDLEGKL